MKVGVVCGKFYPLHEGHRYLIRQAVAASDVVYGMVVQEPNEWPTGAQRLEWAKELFPQVLWSLVTNIPGKEDDSVWWANLTREVLIADWKYDGHISHVVTSEGYGDSWAAALGCNHIEVDSERSNVPISGTQCRNDPIQAWDYLTQPAKEFYALRVCLVGGESVGKTTMARDLAEHFETLWVPEVGRFYTDEFGVKTNDKGIWNTILSDQLAFENHLAQQCNGLLFCDTDLLTTSVWYENWVGVEDKTYEKIQIQRIQQKRRLNRLPYDLYLFLDHTVPWVQDGTRSEGEDEKRTWYSKKLMEGVRLSEVPYVIIDDDDYNNRLADGIAACQRLIESPTT